MGETPVSADVDGNLLYQSTFSGKAGKEAISRVAKDLEGLGVPGQGL